MLHGLIKGHAPLGKGENGATYAHPLIKSRVIKKVRVRTEEERQKVDNEVRLQTFLGERGLAPKVYALESSGGAKIEVSGKHMYYCMQRMHPVRRWTVNSFETLLETMEATVLEHGIVHNDLHQGNVMRSGAGKTLPVDFGLSVRIPPEDLVPKGGCESPSTIRKRILFSQMLLLLESCNANNTECSSSCGCEESRSLAMDALHAWIRRQAHELEVPAKRDLSGCVSHVERTFPGCAPYVKLQILLGLIVHNFLLGCYFKRDNDSNCQLLLADWSYYIRNMPYSHARKAWQLARKGSDPPPYL